MPGNPPIASLYVVSDLHLAPPGEHCVFAAHEPLVSLIDFIAARPTPQWLLLNGDVFDFLQIPGYDALSLPLAPARMQQILDELDTLPPSRNIVHALRRLTAAGHTLCCLPGNHDAELNLYTVQQVLQQRIGSSQTLAPAAGEWRLDVAGHEVIGRHGHYADAFNAISGQALAEAQARGDATLTMPPGSRLVCQAINPFRRARDTSGALRFPFIDRLPSEQAVILALLLLDPVLALRRLKDALGPVTHAIARRTLQQLSGSPPLLGSSTSPTIAASTDPAAAWLDLLAAELAAAARDEQPADSVLAAELDAYFLGLSASASTEPTELLSGDGGLVRRLLWRALGNTLERARDAFRPSVADALARDAIGSWGRRKIAIAGHTHAAKSIATLEGSVYLNTGTWLDLALPPPRSDIASVQAWLDALQRDQLPCWQGHPVAVVDTAGARLLHWNGSALQPWAEAVPAA